MEQRAMDCCRPPHWIDVHVRWLTQPDMKPVARIEEGSYHKPWSKDEFIRILNGHRCVGVVAEHNHQVVGYMIYMVGKRSYSVLNLTVDPHLRRRGIGRQLIEKLRGRLNPDHRAEADFALHIDDLVGQQFLTALGFYTYLVDGSQVYLKLRGWG